MRQLTVSAGDAGSRLDRYLMKYLNGAPAGLLYRQMRKKNITLNRRKCAGPERLAEGDTIELFLADDTIDRFSAVPEAIAAAAAASAAAGNTLPRKGGHHPEEYNRHFPEDVSRPEAHHGHFSENGSDPETLDGRPTKGLSRGGRSVPPLSVLFQNGDILIADKPAGILSQGDDSGEVSMVDLLLRYVLDYRILSEEQMKTSRPAVCSRLDRNTSGLLLCGLTRRGSAFLSEKLRTRDLKKFYLCLVRGICPRPEQLSGWLVKDQRTNQVTVFFAPEQIPEKARGAARQIRTDYRPLAYGADATLLCVHLVTGRTHQIRAHLASVGHPLIGERKYGYGSTAATGRSAGERQTGARRQMLHAWRVVFPEISGDFAVRLDFPSAAAGGFCPRSGESRDCASGGNALPGPGGDSGKRSRVQITAGSGGGIIRIPAGQLHPQRERNKNRRENREQQGRPDSGRPCAEKREDRFCRHGIRGGFAAPSWKR